MKARGFLFWTLIFFGGVVCLAGALVASISWWTGDHSKQNPIEMAVDGFVDSLRPISRFAKEHLGMENVLGISPHKDTTNAVPQGTKRAAKGKWGGKRKRASARARASVPPSIRYDNVVKDHRKFLGKHGVLMEGSSIEIKAKKGRKVMVIGEQGGKGRRDRAPLRRSFSGKTNAVIVDDKGNVYTLKK